MSDSGNPYAAPEHGEGPRAAKKPAELAGIRAKQLPSEILARALGVIALVAAVTGSLSVAQVLQQEIVLGKAQLLVSTLVGFAWLVAGVWLLILDAKGRVLYCLLAAIACAQMAVTMWTDGTWGLWVPVAILVTSGAWLVSGRTKVVLGRYYRRVVVPATTSRGRLTAYLVPVAAVALFGSTMVLDLLGLLP